MRVMNLVTLGVTMRASTIATGANRGSKLSQVNRAWLIEAMACATVLVCAAPVNGCECHTTSLSITCWCMKKVLPQYMQHTIASKNVAMERCTFVICGLCFFNTLTDNYVNNILILRCKGNKYLSHIKSRQCYFI